MVGTEADKRATTHRCLKKKIGKQMSKVGNKATTGRRDRENASNGHVRASPTRSEPTSLNIVDNAAAMTATEIERIESPEPERVTQTRSAVIGNPAEQQVEEIRPSTPASNAPRIANGFKIVDNRAYQRKERIRSAPLTVPAGDEIEYKKLFTKFEEAFTARDMAALRKCLSPAFTWKLPNGQVVYGRDNALEEMERRFAMPNGPRFSASVWRFSGQTVLQTYDVEYMGPDGRWRQSKGFDYYEIGQGLITLKDAYWKMIP